MGYGNTFGNTGIQVNFLRRQADQLGYANYQINDFSTKIKFTLSNKSSLGLKLGIYDETSNSTYIGLTQTMYDKGDQDFALMAPDDRLTIRRYSISLTHKHEFNKNLILQTSLFGYTTTRNWQRQDFSSSATVSNRTGIVWGNPSVPNGAVYMRNSTGNRNRQFEVLGIEPRLTYKFALGQKQAELQVGMRYLYERAFEQRINGKKYNAPSGDMVENEVRTGKAFSVFAQQQISLTSKFGITGGIRLEQYSYERQILRNTFRIRNTNVLVDTNLVANYNIGALIVGAGFNYNFSENMTVFGGVHRGFAPPRVKDAISNLGEVYQLNAEESWNYEIGTRGKIKNLFNYELTAFYMDFANQIIPVSESSGGTGTGLVNGGRTLHQGLEMGLGFDFAKLFSPEYLLRWQVNATYVDARYSADRFVGEKNIKGNRTPYAPPFFLSNTLNFEMPFGLGGNLSSTYVSRQFGDELNTTTATADGRIGEIPSYQIFDINMYYRMPKRNFSFNLAVKNLTNERYMATRRPQGIRVGLPRFITAGFEITF